MSSFGSDDQDSAASEADSSSTGSRTPTHTPSPTPQLHEYLTQDTQPATQPVSAELLERCSYAPDDVSDVVCILHPTSAPACQAVEFTAATHPGNVLRDHLSTSIVDGQEQQRPTDIALRLSQFHTLVNPTRGWVFGRNPRLADICLAKSGTTAAEKKISNQHFRIYVNGHGIVMLEDTSTNGTLVEGLVLSAKNPKCAMHARMLTHGSTVQIQLQELDPINFVVWFPTRTGDAQTQFEQSFREWLLASFRARLIEPPEPDCMLEQFLAKPKAQREPSYELHRWEEQHKGPKGAKGIITVPTANHSFGMHWNGAPDYNVVGLIGKGAFATVYKVAAKRTGRLYACKELDKRAVGRNTNTEKMINQELQVMRRLFHPHVVRFHESYEMPDEGKHLYLIMEYVRHGELASYLADHPNGRLPESECQVIANQLIHAIEYLHAASVTHRDIKPENILISSWDPLRVKLTDFGLSKIVDVALEQQEQSLTLKEKENTHVGGTFLKTFCGTLLYCAPEVYPGFEKYRKKKDMMEAEDEKEMTLAELRSWVIRRKNRPKPRTYGQSVDIWSYATVMFHLLAGKPPFAPTAADKHGAAMLRRIMTTDADWKQLREARVTPNAEVFLRTVLRRFPEERPREQEILSLGWLRNVEEEVDYQQYIDIENEARGVRGERVLFDEDGNALDEKGNVIDAEEEERKMKEELRKLKAIADEVGYTKSAIKAYEFDMKRQEAKAKREAQKRDLRQKKQEESNNGKPGPHESIDSDRSEDEEWERQQKRRRQKSPSLDELDEDVLARANAKLNPPKNKSDPITPTKSVKKQRTITGSTITKRAEMEERRSENTSPHTPTRQRTIPEQPDTLPSHSTKNQKEPFIWRTLPRPDSDEEPDDSFAAIRKRRRPKIHFQQTSPPRGQKDDPPSAQASPAADRRTPPDSGAANTNPDTANVEDNSHVNVPGTQPKQMENPFTKMPTPGDTTGNVSPSAARTQRALVREETDDEKDVAIHSFGISVEITASLSLKDRDSSRRVTRASADERNVFTNGVKIAGKGGIPPGQPYESQNHRSFSKRDVDADKKGDQNLSLNAPRTRQNRTQMRPPSVRLAEIKTNDETEGEQNNYDQDDQPTGTDIFVSACSHPYSSQQPASKVPKSLQPPIPEFGKLIPLHGSFFPRSIHLQHRLTSWGRGLNNTVRYPDPNELRIPKYALEIAFWAPGIEAAIDRGVPWKSYPGLTTILGTRASNSIFVNGVELRRTNSRGDARCFGQIYSGDTITIYRDDKSFLAFRCLLFLGEGRMKRPETEGAFRIKESRFPHGIDPERPTSSKRPSRRNSGVTVRGQPPAPHPRLR